MKIQFSYPFDISCSILEVDLSEFHAFGINCIGETESNSFLLSLWNQLNKAISPENSPNRVPWAYFPQKYIGKKVNVSIFGFAQTKIGEFLIGISYKQKGNIDNLLILNPQGKYKLSRIQKDTFHKLITQAKENINNTTNFLCKAEIDISIKDFKINTYSSVFFILKSENPGNINLWFKIEAIDYYEAKQSAYEVINNFCAFLSVETNLNYSCRRFEIIEGEDLPNESNSCKYFASDYIDYYPTLNWELLISHEGFLFLNNYLFKRQRFQPYDNTVKNFLSACKHCKEGLAKDSETETKQLVSLPTITLSLSKKGTSFQQEIVSNMLLYFMSSIECLTANDQHPEICKECGSPKYKIARRVKDLSTRYLGEELGKVMYELYNYRSKFIHAGKVVTDENRLDTIPLINSSTGTGLMDYAGISIKSTGKMLSIANIKEWTTYLLRCYYKENLFGKTRFEVFPESDNTIAFPIQINAVRPDTVPLISKVFVPAHSSKKYQNPRKRNKFKIKILINKIRDIIKSYKLTIQSRMKIF